MDEFYNRTAIYLADAKFDALYLVSPLTDLDGLYEISRTCLKYRQEFTNALEGRGLRKFLELCSIAGSVDSRRRLEIYTPAAPLPAQPLSKLVTFFCHVVLCRTTSVLAVDFARWVRTWTRPLLQRHWYRRRRRKYVKKHRFHEERRSLRYGSEPARLLEEDMRSSRQLSPRQKYRRRNSSVVTRRITLSRASCIKSILESRESLERIRMPATNQEGNRSQDLDLLSNKAAIASKSTANFTKASSHTHHTSVHIHMEDCNPQIITFS